MSDDEISVREGARYSVANGMMTDAIVLLVGSALMIETDWIMSVVFAIGSVFFMSIAYGTAYDGYNNRLWSAVTGGEDD